MKFLPAMSLAVCLLALSGCGGLMSPTPAGDEPFPLQSPDLARVPELAGLVPLPRVLTQARVAGVVLSAPDRLVRGYAYQIPCSPKDDWWAILQKVELATSSVYDAGQKRLMDPTATHPLDGPDEAGRATAGERLGLSTREIVRMRFRFARVGAGVGVNTAADKSLIEVSGGGNAIDFAAVIPAGVQRTWAVQSERTYFERITNTDSGETFETTRQTVPAGVDFTGMAGALPGGFFRMTATLSVSSFEADLNRTVVEVPLDIDARRGEWVKVFQFRAANANLRATLKEFGLNLTAGGEIVAVLVRVD